jgi:hypothetical protein
MGKPSEDSAPYGVSSDGNVVFSSCWSGGDVGVMVTFGGGGGGDQTLDPVTGDPRSASLVLDLGARVLVGLPLGPTRILAIHLGAGLSGESSIGMTYTGSSSSSSSVTATSSPPSFELSDECTVHLDTTG